MGHTPYGDLTNMYTWYESDLIIIRNPRNASMNLWQRQDNVEGRAKKHSRSLSWVNSGNYWELSSQTDKINAGLTVHVGLSKLLCWPSDGDKGVENECYDPLASNWPIRIMGWTHATNLICRFGVILLPLGFHRVGLRLDQHSSGAGSRLERSYTLIFSATFAGNLDVECEGELERWINRILF